MLGHSRCALTQHELRNIRYRGVGPGNEVERRENKVAALTARQWPLGWRSICTEALNDTNRSAEISFVGSLQTMQPFRTVPGSAMGAR